MIGWSSSPFIIEPRLSHFKVHPIPIQLWVGPPIKSSVISTAAFQWELSDYVTTGPRKINEMFLHCTKLTLDHQPLYILDPLASKQHLNGWDVSPLYKIDPWPLTSLHSWPFTLKTEFEWMRWLFIARSWPLKLKGAVYHTISYYCSQICEIPKSKHLSIRKLRPSAVPLW